MNLSTDTALEIFNPSARDGALVWVALRMVPVALTLAAVFSAVLA